MIPNDLAGPGPKSKSSKKRLFLRDVDVLLESRAVVKVRSTRSAVETAGPRIRMR